MKKILFTILAIFAVLFTSCTKEDDYSSSGIKGGTAYSGDLLGNWSASMNFDGYYSGTFKLTFYSDGGMNYYMSLKSSDWSEITDCDCLFYVKDDIIAMEIVSAVINDDGEVYEEDAEGIWLYFKVIELTSKTLKIWNLEEALEELDYSEAQEYFDKGWYEEMTFTKQ